MFCFEYTDMNGLLQGLGLGLGLGISKYHFCTKTNTVKSMCVYTHINNLRRVCGRLRAGVAFVSGLHCSISTGLFQKQPGPLFQFLLTGQNLLQGRLWFFNFQRVSFTASSALSAMSVYNHNLFYLLLAGVRRWGKYNLLLKQRMKLR